MPGTLQEQDLSPSSGLAPGWLRPGSHDPVGIPVLPPWLQPPGSYCHYPGCRQSSTIQLSCCGGVRSAGNHGASLRSCCAPDSCCGGSSATDVYLGGGVLGHLHLHCAGLALGRDLCIHWTHAWMVPRGNVTWQIDAGRSLPGGGYGWDSHCAAPHWLSAGTVEYGSHLGARVVASQTDPAG